MDAVIYRPFEMVDVGAAARIRALEWGTVEYWENRIAGYLRGELHPQMAMASRTAFAAFERDAMLGFVAGHLTRRFGCDAELEWINVILERRKHGVATELLLMMGAWFAEQGAVKVCVDVEPANTAARNFYFRAGAEELKPHWLVWPDIREISRYLKTGRYLKIGNTPC